MSADDEKVNNGENRDDKKKDYDDLDDTDNFDACAWAQTGSKL